MGIDVGALRERRREPDVSYWVQLLRQRYAGMMIVVGRDKLDEIQGVRHKLEAFELFLKKWPEYQGKVCFVIPSFTPSFTFHPFPFHYSLPFDPKCNPH
jgi:trehalose-6-phosphate synthase